MTQEEQWERMFPVNHKTVIVIDHSQSFSMSSNEMINLDNIGGSKHAAAGNRIQLFSKTLWTCAVEAVLEYCRIVLDLFPCDEKVFSLVSADDEARVLTAWFSEDQIYDQLLKVFRDEGAPVDSSLSLNGAISECLTMLMYLTTKQAALLDKPDQLRNRARVVFLTHFDSDEAVNDFALSFVKETKTRNASKLANNYSEFQVHHCHLVLVCVRPLGTEPRVTERDSVRFGDLLRLSVHNCQAGESLARGLVNLTRQHYNLASTCVQDIPMKEETPAAGQQQSNRNYDVELLHEASAHADYVAMGSFSSMALAGEHLIFPESFGLKWLTPKNQSVDLLNCARVCRVTAADVTARHSVCLINFLRGPPSRFVMLESKQQSPGATTNSSSNTRRVTHMLASHAGDIYLHVLEPGKPLLEELPPAAESRCLPTAGCPIKLTDYRTSDFRDVMKRSRLFPARETGDYPTLPRVRAVRHLERSTLYWPLTINDSVLLSASSSAKSLLSLLSEESLDDEEIKACENLVKKFLDMEVRGEPITVSNRSLRSARREDLYRLLFMELDSMLCRYALVSDGHAQVLTYLRRFRPPEPLSSQPTGLNFLDNIRLQQLDSDSQQHQLSVTEPVSKRSRVASGAAAPPPAPVRSNQSVQDWYEDRVRSATSGRRPEFHGRLVCPAGEIYPLYQHLAAAAAASTDLQQQQQQQQQQHPHQQKHIRSKDPRISLGGKG
ncbi:hypothetical protein BOX15_Mlig015828g1 [Macrostomum lignano]|uniref:Set apart in position or space protein n=1 Tax=Macrostomum lignano TaxID=282301 RepID=A0A267DUE0_9PLAT|nr:hypothetical protein BOX15_Mlig015828g1 [Macrostomum lignano]